MTLIIFVLNVTFLLKHFWIFKLAIKNGSDLISLSTELDPFKSSFHARRFELFSGQNSKNWWSYVADVVDVSDIVDASDIVRIGIFASSGWSTPAE